MLRIHSDTGSIELTATQERAVRSLSDASVCEALNRGSNIYVHAVICERPALRFSPVTGWYFVPSSSVSAWRRDVRLH
jgi:hypothetical protein